MAWLARCTVAQKRAARQLTHPRLATLVGGLGDVPCIASNTLFWVAIRTWLIRRAKPPSPRESETKVPVPYVHDPFRCRLKVWGTKKLRHSRVLKIRWCKTQA